MGAVRVPSLADVVSSSIVLCYTENVDRLTKELDASGLVPQVQRATYSVEQLAYPANTRTFLNHRDAWEKASTRAGYTLICESDFVPCKNIAKLKVFWPLERPLAWGYLYQGSPRVLCTMGSTNSLRGHCAPLVAYAINAEVAKIMLEYYENAAAKYGLRNYFTFDANLQWWLMGRGAEAFIPLRHYGEHGGRPNREHKAIGGLPRAGRHRADNLAGTLAFLPHYAEGSRAKFWKERFKARALGWARLFTGRWVIYPNWYNPSWKDRVRLYWIGVVRLIG